MILANGISKTYRVKKKSRGLFKKKEVQAVDAVKGVSLEIKPGEIVGLLGVNGAGKTTTIKMLSTMLEPTSGTLSVDGLDAVTEHQKIKSIINIITSGERNLYWRLTARENLEYFGSLYSIPNKLLSERINTVLATVALEEVADIPVEKYSKGMKQRLQIARGLINDPKYVFLDEPTLGLDVIIAQEMRAYIRDLALKENKGVLLTTHYMVEADELCDYIYLIHGGEIICKGTPSFIKTQYDAKHQYKFQIEKHTNELEKALQQLQEITPNTYIDLAKENLEIVVVSEKDLANEIMTILDRCDCSLFGMIKTEPSLENSLVAAIKGG